MRQLEQITNHLLERNYQNYITLLPAGRHSATINKVLKDRIVENDATLARVEFYSKNSSDIEKSLKLINDTVDNLNENDLNIKQPVVFMAGDQTALEALLEQAKNFNLDKKATLAGDNRINLDITEPVNVTFTGSMEFIDVNFPAKAEKLGVKQRNFMHALAYDAGKMVGNYIGLEYNKVRFLARMNAGEPFIGVAGNVYFTDSIAQRKYDIIRKEDGQYSVLK
jgi:hypothetical protein